MTPKLKDVAETLIYEFPFRRELGSERVKRIVAVNSLLQPGTGEDGDPPLSVTRQAYGTDHVRIELDGGQDGRRYLVSVEIEDTAARTFRTAQEFTGLDLAWSRPAGASAYVELKDFILQVGLGETVRLTDEDGRGTPDPERLGAALTAAESIAETHIASRYRTPLATIPDIVRISVIDLAHERLYLVGDLPDGVRRKADAARRTLERIGEGKLRLPGAEEPEGAPSPQPVKIATAGRTYPPGSLDGFMK